MSHNDQDVFARLASGRKRHDWHLQEVLDTQLAREEQEEEELQDRPLINSRSQILASPSFGSIHSKLFLNAEQRQHEQDLIEQLSLQKEYQLVQLNQMHDTQPDQEVEQQFLFRQSLHQQHRIQSLQQLKQIEEEKSSALFSPNINLRSQVIAQKAKEHYLEQETHTRLVQNNKSDRILMQLQKYEQIYAMQHPFQPKVNSSTSKSKPFLDRQDDHQQILHSKLTQAKSKVDASMTFRPEINPFSELLVKTADKSRVKRIKTGVDRELTFKPEINEFSKILTKHHFLSEYDQQQQKKQRERKEAMKRESQVKEMEECTFQPQVNTSAKNIYPIESSHKVVVVEQMKKAKISEIQQEKKKQQELQECTFKPKVNRTYNKSEKTVLIQGLDNFLGSRDKKKRQVEAQERQSRDPMLKYHALRHIIPTMPKPFNLS